MEFDSARAQIMRSLIVEIHQHPLPSRRLTAGNHADQTKCLSLLPSIPLIFRLLVKKMISAIWLVYINE